MLLPGSVLYVKPYDPCSSKAESGTVLLTSYPPVKINNFSSSIRASSLPFTVFHSGLELMGYINVAFHGSVCCFICLNTWLMTLVLRSPAVRAGVVR